MKKKLKIYVKLLSPVVPDWAHVMLETVERISETE